MKESIYKSYDELPLFPIPAADMEFHGVISPELSIAEENIMFLSRIADREVQTELLSVMGDRDKGSGDHGISVSGKRRCNRHCPGGIQK